VQDKSTAAGKWRQQHKTELDGDKWSVAYVPPAAKRHKSRLKCATAMTTTTLNLTKVGISFVETFQRAFHSSKLFILIQPYILHNVLLQYHQGHKKYVIQNDTFVRPKSQLCRRFAANFQFSSKCSSLKGIKFANGKILRSLHKEMQHFFIHI